MAAPAAQRLQKFAAITAFGWAILASTTMLAVAATPAGTDPRQLVSDDNIRLHTLGTTEGLSQSSVPTLTQDEYGFIWLGTSDGLNRYDGHQVKIWRRDEHGLSRSSVESLCVDAQGALWVGLFDGGVHRYDTARGQFGPLRPADGSSDGVLPGRVHDCLADRDGTVWFATDAGLSRYDAASNLFRHWPLQRPGGTDYGHQLLALQRNRQGQLLALGSHGLYRLDDEQNLQPLPNIAALVARSTLSQFLIEDDAILIGTNHAGLWRWQLTDDRLLPEPMPDFPAPLQITAMLRDRDGRLWLGTETRGVLMQERRRGAWLQVQHRPGQSDSLPDNHIRSLFQSREGVIWIGTWLAGVSRFDPLQTSFRLARNDPTRQDSLPVSSVRSVLAEPGVLWVGSDGGGVSRSLDGGRHFDHFRHDPTASNRSLSNNHVRFIHRDRAGRLWLGTENGLNRFDNARITPLWLPDPPSLADSARRLRAIAEAPDGTLWLGSFGGGLIHYDPISQQTEYLQSLGDTSAGLCGNRVVVLQHDLDGSLLIGTDDGGLCRRQPDGRFERLLPVAFSIWSLHVDPEAIWIGSYGDALLKYHRRSQRVHRFNHRHGITDDVIYAILPDSRNQLWLSSNDGLFRFDPVSEKAEAYPVSAGLQDREFNSGAATRGADGRLYFGGIRGLNWFDPTEVALNMMPPRSTITRVEVMQRDTGIPIYANHQLNLAADESSLALELSAQHYSSPDSNRFRYRLLPIESAWQELGNGQHRLQYNQLQAGEYRLELRAGSAAGVWDPEVRQLAIAVAPTFWRSGPAYALYLLVTGVLLGLYWQHGHRNRQREQAMLAVLREQVDQRTAELQSKNQSLEHLNEELQLANERLEAMSLTDPLTGLGNRRLLFRHLEKDAPAVLRLHQDAGKQLQPARHADLLFFLIDLDHFKRVNDSFGHAIGDEVLVGVKNRLQQICREQDFLVRYGGEEFLLVSRYCDRSIGPQLAERIRSVIGDQTLMLASGVRLSVTCSIGYAAFPLNPDQIHAFSCEQVLQVADSLLYVAKYSGRNQWLGATSSQESQADRLLSRLRTNGEPAITAGDIELMSSQRSLKRLRWQPLADDRYQQHSF